MPASAWMTSSSYLHQQHTKKKKKYTKVSPTKIAKFQIWNAQNGTWNSRVTKKLPTILTEKDIINWQHFKTQKLHFNQLYLWYATPTEWIPLWALESGFLLINNNFIRYADISLNQLTTTKWIKLNAISPKCIAQLLGVFNQTVESFSGVAISTKKNRKNNFQTITGTSYFNPNPFKQLGPSVYRPDLRFWENYCIFNKHDQRFHYEFLKFFHMTYHQSDQAIGLLMVKNFQQAAIDAKIGNSYIYHELNVYIPFWKVDEESIQINSKTFLKINTIPDDIKDINHITNNRHNTITKNEFTKLNREIKQLFVDKELMKYKLIYC